ncbi:MAG: 30S ribosomal protein S6 [bacterium]
MNQYELLILLNPGLSEDEANTLTETVQKMITDQGGQITKQESLGKKKLAYPIAHNKQGYYELMQYTFDPANLNDFERGLRLEQGLLRHQNIRLAERSPEAVAAEKDLQDKLRVRRLSAIQTETAKPKVVTKPPVQEKIEQPEQTEEERRASLEELDKKLDDILKDEIIK